MENKYTAVVITVSDKGSIGERVDTSGPALVKILEEENWQVLETTIIPDDMEKIQEELIKAADKNKAALILTTGGTGFSKRDVTPEATMAVIERHTPGIGEAMRLESLKITNRAMLSRATAGLRGDSLIVNLPGSEKAAKECLWAVLGPIKHGIDILRGYDSNCGGDRHHHHDHK